MSMNLQALIRYRTIDRCIRNIDQSWNWEALAEACAESLVKETGLDKKPSRRTIMEDIKNMRSGKLGYQAPIEYDKKEKSYYYSDATFSIDNIPLKQEHLTELNQLLLILKQFSGKSSLQGVENIVTQLEETFKIKRKRTKPIIQFEQSLNELGQKWVNPIYKAIQSKQSLNIQYEPFDKPAFITIISPYLLKQYNNRWFVFGKAHKYDSISHLGLDRIQSIQPSLQSYQSSKSFDPTVYLQDIVGVSIPKEGEKIKIVLKAYGVQRHYIRTKPIHPSQELIEMTDEYALFSLYLITNYELKSRLLGYMDTLEVVEPHSFRKEMRQMVENIKGIYG